MPMVAALDILVVDSPQGEVRLGDICQPEFQS